MSLPLKELIRIGEKQLADAGVADAAPDAKSLYCFMDKLDSVGLMMHWQDVLADNICEEYFDLVERRASGEPLQYITGNQAFMGLEFMVNPSVLIPRQDTETMVEDAIEVITKGTLRGMDYAKGQNIKDVLDLCCGSGAIGISIAKLCEKTKVVCSDISDEALVVANHNARVNGCKNLKIQKSDLFESFSGKLGNKKFDMIISNPPYIKSDVIPKLQREVKDHEPLLALDGGRDGLDFYRRIVKEAASHLQKEGILMMEIGWDQGSTLLKMLEETQSFEKIGCLKDLAGRDRIVIAQLKKKNK